MSYLFKDNILKIQKADFYDNIIIQQYIITGDKNKRMLQNHSTLKFKKQKGTKRLSIPGGP